MEEQNQKQKKDNFDLTDGTNDLYYALTSSKPLIHALQDVGAYLRHKRQTIHPSGQVFPISTKSSAILTVYKNDTPVQGPLSYARGHIFSEFGMTRNWPLALDLGETKLSFARPKALAWKINTIHRLFRIYDVSAVGSVVEKFTLTEREIRAFNLRSIQEQAEEELPPGEIRSSVKGNAVKEMVETATSPIVEFCEEVAGEQNNCEPMEVEGEGEIEGEIIKDKTLEHEGQREKTASTASTMPKVGDLRDLPTDISDHRIELEKENERLKTEKSVAVERIAFLEEEDKKKTERISRLETEDQTLRNQVSNLQQQLEALTTQLTELQTKYAGLDTNRTNKRKKIKLNSGEPLQTDQQNPNTQKENSLPVEYQFPELEEQKQGNLHPDLNHGNRTGHNADGDIKPNECKDPQIIPYPAEKQPNPVIQSALDSVTRYETTGLGSGVIDLFINLYCIKELGKRSIIKIYESTKWDDLSMQEKCTS